ncbi:unnamed protein product [Protopolystoma xenopodis]|uniref:Uncharacterized protein n=1 Tax=Protopolystoma xenopodis TaxID=117903 RepID=A0A3S5AUZ2_9PLAT|nr:unnamed protein product [Protopolystoma xenopodis]
MQQQQHFQPQYQPSHYALLSSASTAVNRVHPAGGLEASGLSDLQLGSRLQQQQQQQISNQPKAIQPEEVEAMLALLDLTIRVCQLSASARTSIVLNPHWQVVPVCIGLVTCPLPVQLKARLINLLTALLHGFQSTTPDSLNLLGAPGNMADVVSCIWDGLISSEFELVLSIWSERQGDLEQRT